MDCCVFLGSWIPRDSFVMPSVGADEGWVRTYGSKLVSEKEGKQLMFMVKGE